MIKSIKLKNKIICALGFVLTFAIFGVIFSIAPKSVQAESITASKILSGFTAENATVKYDNNTLVYTFNDNSSLISPTINSPKGTAMSAKLNVKNTIMMVIANESAINRVKVYFTTNLKPLYSEENSKEFDLKPNSDYTAYYFNLSSLQGANGYLRGIKLCTNGSGTLKIKDLSFQREDVTYAYAGKVTSCLKVDDNIEINYSVASNYVGKILRLYETNVTNYLEKVSDCNLIRKSECESVYGTLTIPFYSDKVTYLSSQFILTVDNIKVDKMFKVENYGEVDENPYAFSVPNKTVSVTDYGAKGDGFTNDTSAIQNAIDSLAQQGGGTVNFPKDDSFYGKRYVVTNIRLSDNISLNIEDNAILWQSEKSENYDYDVVYDHDITLPGVYWAHAGLTVNYPLIYGNNVKNIKITGGGTIRMADTGNELLDYTDAQNLGCSNRIHLVPIGLYKCENIEISDIKIIRNSTYHIALFADKNIFISGVTLTDVVCRGGDGISLGMGTRNVAINSSQLYTTDDAIVLWSSSVNEKRGLKWWQNIPNGDNRIMNITLKHNYVTGGHGLTFVTWGSDATDLSKQEICSIRAEDNVFGNGNTAIAGWFDNPYYGSSTAENGFAGELNDYSPIKDIYVCNNSILGFATFNQVPATNVVTDCNFLNSANQFVNADFSRKSSNDNFINGLSYWSVDESQDNEVQAVTLQNNNLGLISSSVRGENALYQGLSLKAGTYRFVCRAGGDGGKLFVRKALTNEIVKETNILSNELTKSTIEFKIEKSGTYHVGCKAAKIEGRKIYLDDAAIENISITSDVNPFFSEDFSSQLNPLIETKGFKISDDGGIVGAANNEISSLEVLSAYSSADLIYRLQAQKDGYGFKIHFNQNMWQSYQLEYNNREKYLRLNKINAQTKTVLNTAYGVDFSSSVIELIIDNKNGLTRCFLNKQLVLSALDTVKPITKGTIGLYTADKMIVKELSVANQGTADVNETVYTKYFTEDFTANVNLKAYGWEMIKKNGLDYISNDDFTSQLTLDNDYLTFDMIYKLKAPNANCISLSMLKNENAEYQLLLNVMDKTVKVVKNVNGKSTVLSLSKTFEAELTNWFYLGVSKNDDTFNIYLNGQLVYTGKDLNEPLGSGAISISADASNLLIDSLTVAENGTLDFTIKEEPPITSSDDASTSNGSSTNSNGCGGCAIKTLMAYVVLQLFICLVCLKKK